MYVWTQNGLGQSAISSGTSCSGSVPQLPQGRPINNQTVICDILLISLWRLQNDLKSLQDETKELKPDRERIRELEQCVLKQAERIIRLLNQGNITQHCCVDDLDKLQEKVKKLPWVFGWQERYGKNIVRVTVLRKTQRCYSRLMDAIRNAYMKAPISPCCDCWASV
jgi:hypothetical protein